MMDTEHRHNKILQMEPRVIMQDGEHVKEASILFKLVKVSVKVSCPHAILKLLSHQPGFSQLGVEVSSAFGA